jgi:catechol 2,3-dioxygenase-like lactoylglutathione lyase family enzyme
MFAQINHMAIISPAYGNLEKFYQAVFGLRPSARTRPGSAATTGDGYVGLNLIPRRDGYIGGIDHFGMVVDDVEPVLERMQKKYRNANIVKRPSARPFAAYSGHDPDGNVFDLAQKKQDTRKEVYAEIAAEGWAQDRYFNKFAIRTPNAEQCAEFYADVFALQPVNRENAAPGHHLSDGRVTLSILPWSIDVFEGMSIKRPGPDHVGFHVENLDSFKAQMADERSRRQLDRHHGRMISRTLVI